MSVLYLDASAITKLVVEEPETQALRSRVEGERLVTSRVAVVEVTKAASRASASADAQPILSRLAFVELDAELARLAATTGGTSLRSLDAIHVASAVRLGPEVVAFVTYDERQGAAAVAVGLPTEAPR
ncbi:MAG TPA: type II toxin-antitoxin system VapC family toxin [Candidatus Limnocylindrales bacterium]|nr:type II toxin-antitoxin system VapC family toxin [Candidatus Limnocylindrales bacterium]